MSIKNRMQENLRIMLLLTSVLDIGGGQRDVLTLAEKLARRGHSIFIVSRKGDSKTEFKHENIKHIKLSFGKYPLINFISTIADLKKIIIEKKINVINPQSIMTTLLVFLALKFSKLKYRKYTPIITTIHNIHNRKRDKPSVFILNTCPNLTIFVSEYERQRLVKKGLNLAKTKVVYSGIDNKVFDISKNYRNQILKELNIDINKPIVGTIGRLSEEKGLQYFIEAASKINKQNPEVFFIVVGDGPERNNLQNLASELKITNDIIFTGFRNDIYQMLSAIDIFVLTSLRESLPVSIREAMAMKKTVVATNVGGVSEIIEDEVSGFLVPEKDSDTLAKIILELLNNKEERTRISNKGQEVIKNNFSMDVWINRTEQIYKESINNKLLIYG